MAEINLLRGEKKHVQHGDFKIPGTGKPLIWFLLAVLLLTLAVYGVFYFLDGKTISELASVNGRIAQVEKNMSDPPPEFKDAIKAQSALNEISGMLDRHIYWTNVWEELGRNTLKTARYFSLSATTENSIFVIDGTVDNYSELGKLMLGLQGSSRFKDVQMISSGPGKGEATGVEFSLAVEYKPDLLLKNSPTFENSQTQSATTTFDQNQ